MLCINVIMTGLYGVFRVNNKALELLYKTQRDSLGWYPVFFKKPSLLFCVYPWESVTKTSGLTCFNAFLSQLFCCPCVLVARFWTVPCAWIMRRNTQLSPLIYLFPFQLCSFCSKQAIFVHHGDKRNGFHKFSSMQWGSGVSKQANSHHSGTTVPRHMLWRRCGMWLRDPGPRREGVSRPRRFLAKFITLGAVLGNKDSEHGRSSGFSVWTFKTKFPATPVKAEHWSNNPFFLLRCPKVLCRLLQTF